MSLGNGLALYCRVSCASQTSPLFLFGNTETHWLDFPVYFLKTGLSIDSDKFLVNKFGLDVALKNEMLQCLNKLMKNNMAVAMVV